MKDRYLTELTLKQFKDYLILEERSKATIEKYCRDSAAFADYVHGTTVTKEVAIAYKNKLKEDGYAARSINSMIASINCLFTFLNWHDLKLKTIKIQQEVFCSEEKELTRLEYERLVKIAKGRNNDRLCLILQTICGTGIRVSELQFITVEAAKRGEAEVSCKGKMRTVFIVFSLQKKLLQYAEKRKILTGCIFVTRSGQLISRTNIWREMKVLCLEANVNPSKVFPHNLRHLFARVFYSFEKDIAKLADILGHSCINTTRVYIISTGSEHRKLMEKMRLII